MARRAVTRPEALRRVEARAPISVEDGFTMADIFVNDLQIRMQ
jgi:hypothetical protein